jgi:branched-chain amino acid transport system substrate-binding protein
VLSGTEKALKKRSMNVLAKGTFQRNTIAIKSGLAAMLDAKPDAVVMVGPYTPLAAFIKEARTAGLKAQLATVSFVGTDNLVAEVGKDGDGVVISQVVPFTDDNDMPMQRECREIVSKHANEKLGFVNFEGCITTRVMLAALQQAGNVPTRQALVDTLNGIKGVDVGGLQVALTADNH